MAYKIEDIDWDKMPKGAVEFSLETEEYLLTWYDGNGDAWIHLESPERVEYEHEDGRERHKVSDYHPSTTNLTMSDADKVKYFLKGLTELTNKYKVVIHGCGCMGSPSLHTEDFVDGGCYAVDKNNDFLEYSYEESSQD